MCVISHSMIRVIWRNINAYILESVRSLAVCVISPTVLRVIWRNMLSCTVMCVHIAVLCVIKGLFLRVIWRSMFSVCMVKGINISVMSVTNHSPFCLIWKDINCYTVKTADITVRRAICHSFGWEISENMCWSILMSIHIPVTCVVKVSVIKVRWKNTTVYILESVHTYVKCVISRLLRRVLWIIINVSILESILTSVICVINHSVLRVLLQYIRLFILKSVHLCVMLVKNHLDAGNIWTDTFPCTVWNFCSAVVCVND